MNLAIVSDYAAPYGGNFIRSIEALCEQIKSENDDVVFIFPDRCRNLDWLNALSKKYQVKFGINIQSLWRTIHTEKITVVYTHFCLPKTQLVVKIAARISHVPLVQHWHNHYQKVGGIKGKLIDWAFEGDLNIGCSKPVADSLPFPDQKKAYADNAIDFSRLDHYDDGYCFADNDTQTVILMFGFDYERKGVDLAVEALKPIAAEKNIKLVLSLSNNHEKVRTKIIEQCSYFPKWVQIVDARDDVATYYHAANIFLSAAREEGLCYSPIEAAYCGCNIISSEIDGVPYREIPYCKVFPSKNIQALREVICESLVPNTQQQRVACKAAVVKEFSLENWVEKEITLLHKMSK